LSLPPTSPPKIPPLLLGFLVAALAVSTSRVTILVAFDSIVIGDIAFNVLSPSCLNSTVTAVYVGLYISISGPLNQVTESPAVTSTLKSLSSGNVLFTILYVISPLAFCPSCILAVLPSICSL